MFTSLTTLLLASVAQSADATDQASVRDIEIMRRLLVEAIEESAPAAETRRWNPQPGENVDLTGNPFGYFDGTVSSIYGRRHAVTHSRGFQVPDSGVFFSIDAQVPTRQVATSEEPEEEEARAGDDWERMRREVQTGRKESKESEAIGLLGRTGNVGLSFLAGKTITWELDPEAVDRVTDAVLAALGRHGARIGGLSRKDRITVAIHLSPSNQVSSPVAALTMAQDPAGQTNSNLATLFNAHNAGQAPAQRVVIRVAVDELEGMNGGGATELKRRARVHRY